MGLITEESILEKSVLHVAEQMMIAARTAPKARGISNLVMGIALKNDITILAERIRAIGNAISQSFFLRDATNIEKAQAILLMGTRIKPIDLPKCGHCGFRNCQEKRNHPTIPCAYNTGDLGIAIGSAVSVAMDMRIDNRVMYTIGLAAVELELLGKDVPIIYGIPLSVSSKNIFFDRPQM